MTTLRSVWVGLGANLGDAAGTLKAALHPLNALASGPVQSSGLFRSTAIGAPGPDYLNAVARFDSTLSPESLLEALQAIEQQFGRTRPYPQAPRTLDLDLLLVEGQTRATPVLTLPHPRMLERAFVLRPMARVDPNLMLAGQPITHWLTKVADQACSPLP